jgi:hypothetical protein
MNELLRNASLNRRFYDRERGEVADSNTTRRSYIEQLRDAGQNAAAQRLENAWQDQLDASLFPPETES